MTPPDKDRINELNRFFTNRNDCTTLRQDAQKLLLRAHGQGLSGQDYFIKIFRYPYLIRSRIKGRKFVGGRQEYQVCNRLKSMGISTPKPLGFAIDRNRIGIPKRSLFASLWLDDVRSVDDIVRHQYKRRQMATKVWQSFVRDLGEFLGRIHLLMVNAKDLNTKNILVQWQPETKPRFILVDYEQIAFLKKFDPIKFMKALSQVGAGLLPAFESDIGRLCEGYALQMQQFDATDLSPKLIAASWEKNRQWQRQIDGLFSTIGERLQGHDHT